MSGRRGEWGAAFLLVDLLSAIGAVVGSMLGAVWVVWVLVGFE